MRRAPFILLAFILPLIAVAAPKTSINYTVDYYAVLQLSPNATPGEVTASWMRLRRRYHPDHNPNDPFAADRFIAAKEAYDILSDPKLRGDYNKKHRRLANTPEDGDYRRRWIAEVTRAQMQGIKDSLVVALTKITESVYPQDRRRLWPAVRAKTMQDFDSFFRNAWVDVLRASDMNLDGDKHAETLHRLYWATTELGAKFNERTLFTFDQIPKLILKNAFFAARSARMRAFVAGNCEPRDLDPRTLREWMSYFPPEERLDLLTSLASTVARDAHRNNSTVRHIEPEQEELEVLFLRTHNAALFSQDWRAKVSSRADSQIDAIEALTQVIQSIKNSELAAGPTPFSAPLSREIDKFIRETWEQIHLSAAPDQNGYQALSSALFDFYLNLVSLRNLNLDRDIYVLKELPKSILHTAFIAGQTETRARFALYSRPADLSIDDFMMWLAPLPWSEQQRILIAVCDLPYAGLTGRTNLELRRFAEESTNSLLGHVKTLALRCRDILRRQDH